MDIKTERLNEAFRLSGLSQTELCKRTGINKGALSSYLSGRYFPKQQAIEKLSVALGVSICYLMGLEEPSLSGAAASPVNDDEQVFLDMYRALDPDDRAEVRGFIKGLLAGDKYKDVSIESKAI